MKQEIKYEEFKKIELKIATIKSAEDHPNADKLYVLKIDFGNEERRIVAGIKDHYRKEELIGKQIVIVANLEAAKLRGVESQGMLLAADNGKGKIVLLTPDKKIENGAEVK